MIKTMHLFKHRTGSFLLTLLLGCGSCRFSLAQGVYDIGVSTSFDLNVSDGAFASLCCSVDTTASNLASATVTDSEVQRLGLAALRLSTRLRDEANPAVVARTCLISSAAQLTRLATARHRSTFSSGPVCGNTVCDRTFESCHNCPTDCGSCSDTASVTLNPITGGTWVDLLQTDAALQSLPVGVGPVNINITLSSPIGVPGDLTLRLTGVGQSNRDTYLLPDARTPGFAFSGISFALRFIVSPSSGSPPQLNATIDLARWGRYSDASTSFSVWFFNTSTTQWSSCASRLHLDTSSSVLHAPLESCILNIRNTERQFAIFVDDAIVPFAGTPGAIADTIGNSLADSSLFDGLNVTDALALTVSNQRALDEMPNLLAYFAMPLTSSTTTLAIDHEGDRISLLVRRNRLSELVGDLFGMNVSSQFGTRVTAVRLPPVASWTGVALQTDVVVFGAVVHNTALFDQTNEYVRGSESIFVQMQSTISPVGVALPIVNAPLTPIEVTLYQRASTPFEYPGADRICTYRSASSSTAWNFTGVTTVRGVATDIETVCSSAAFGTVGFAQLIPTTTTTTSSSTSTQSSTTSTQSTTSTTLSTSTTTSSSTTLSSSTLTVSTTTRTTAVPVVNGPAAEANKAWNDDGSCSGWWACNRHYFFWALLVLGILAIFGYVERAKYIRKIVEYEEGVVNGAKLRLKLDVDEDILAPTLLCAKRNVLFRWLGNFGWLLATRNGVFSMFSTSFHACSTVRLPTRLFRVAFVTAVLTLSCGIVALIIYADVRGTAYLPRTDLRAFFENDLGFPITKRPVLDVSRDENGTRVLTLLHHDRLATVSGTRIIVDGMVDGLWALIFGAPIILFLSFCIAKYHGYVDALRALHPIRFRAGFSRARAAMEARGLPIEDWILAAKGEPVPPNRSLSVLTASDLYNNPEYDAQRSYLEVEAAADPNGFDLVSKALAQREAVQAADGVGLGWGTDSLMGDEGLSGAGKAIPTHDLEQDWPQENDSAYQREFTESTEELAGHTNSYLRAVVVVSVGCFLLGLIATLLLAGDKPNMTDDIKDRFVTGVVTAALLFLVVLSIPFLFMISIIQTAFPSQDSPGELAVVVPTARNVVLHKMCI